MTVRDKIRVDILASTGKALCKVEDFIKAISLNTSQFRLHLGKKNRNHVEYFQNIRKSEKVTNQKVNVFLDLPSARPRVGRIEVSNFEVGEIVLMGEKNCANTLYQYLPVANFSSLLTNVSLQDHILLRDGKIGFSVCGIDYENKIITLKCLYSKHHLESFASIILPNSPSDFLEITKDENKILHDLFANELYPEWVCVSFANNAISVEKVRKEVEQIFKRRINIMAKIETQKALDNIEEIVEVSDGVMVARGDLALNISPIKIPRAQEEIIKLCKKKDKYCVVATQILEGYASTSEPHCAELSDIYTAINEGTNCLMLSGESGSSPKSIANIAFLNQSIEAVVNYCSLRVIGVGDKKWR